MNTDQAQTTELLTTVTKLAHEVPALRVHLVPLLRAAGRPTLSQKNFQMLASQVLQLATRMNPQTLEDFSVFWKQADTILEGSGLDSRAFLNALKKFGNSALGQRYEALIEKFDDLYYGPRRSP